MSSKTNKSFTKRLKITRHGKVLSRKTGQNHFNAKESRRKQLKKHSSLAVNLPIKDLNFFVKQ